MSHLRKNEKRVLFLDDWPGSKAIVGSGIGSSLFKLAGIEDAKKAGYKASILTTSPKAELLCHTDTFEQIFCDPEQLKDLSRYDLIVTLGIERPKGLSHPQIRGDFRNPKEVKEDYNLIAHIPYWRRYVAEVLNLPAPTGMASISLSAKPGEIEATEKYGQDFAAISLSAVTHLKRYPHWEKVIRTLSDLGVPMVLLGLEKPVFQLPKGVINLTGKTSMGQLTAILQRSSVVAGTDGLITNMAMFLGKPTVNLFTIIQPEFVIDANQGERGQVLALVHHNCPLQPCYSKFPNYRGVPCPLTPEDKVFSPPACTDFPPERVAQSIFRLYQDHIATERI